MAQQILVLPTEPNTRIEIPADYPIPPIGGDFYINYQQFVPAEEWEAVQSILENDVLTVDKIESGIVYLYEGANPTNHSPDPEEYFQDFVAYWESHPETKPLT